jgi:hypothetical protein
MKTSTQRAEDAAQIKKCHTIVTTEAIAGSLGNQTASTSKPKQFNFARHWNTKIAPCLDDPDVVLALTLGMKLCDTNYRAGDPPWLCGRGPMNGQRATKGCLSWYQPWGRCHHIAPFCWALGQRLFPELSWGFISNDLHTAVVGWSSDCEQPKWVMDILFFRKKSAQASLELATRVNRTFYSSLRSYLSSFCNDPEAAHQILQQMNIEGGERDLVMRGNEQTT